MESNTILESKRLKRQAANKTLNKANIARDSQGLPPPNDEVTPTNYYTKKKHFE